MKRVSNEAQHLKAVKAIEKRVNHATNLIEHHHNAIRRGWKIENESNLECLAAWEETRRDDQTLLGKLNQLRVAEMTGFEGTQEELF